MQVSGWSSASLAVTIGRLFAPIPLPDAATLEWRPLFGLREAAHEDLEEPLGGAPVLRSVVGVELGHGECPHAGVGE